MGTVEPVSRNSTLRLSVRVSFGRIQALPDRLEAMAVDPTPGDTEEEATQVDQEALAQMMATWMPIPMDHAQGMA